MTEVSAGTLTDFLLRRITDTIAEARYVQAELVTAGADQRGMPFLLAEHVIRRCHADRQIIGECMKYERAESPYYDGGRSPLTRTIVRALALPYAGHAEFTPAWRL